MFKKNQHVVFPSHGVCLVKNISSKTATDGSKREFYCLEVLTNQMTIIVPVKGDSGLRPVMTDSEAKSFLTWLRNLKPEIDHSTWNRRYRDFMELLRTGKPKDIGKVYKSLIIIKSSKDLSFGERKMLDYAKELLLTELEIAMPESTLVFDALDYSRAS